MYVVLDVLVPGAEFAADRGDDFRLGRAVFKEFKNLGSNDIQVEHLTLLDVQDDGAILPVRAAYSVRHSVHRISMNVGLFLEPIVRYTLPSIAMKTPLILDLVREMTGLFGIPQPSQEDTRSTSGFAGSRCVRYSDVFGVVEDRIRFEVSDYVCLAP